MGIKERVPAAERDLTLYLPAPAEGQQIVQDGQSLFQRQRGSLAAVIAVPAMKIAGLSYMPLKGKEGRG
jgi:hypothetical protein